MTEIKFVNHASVLVSHGNIRLLSDPWYFGSAFADGWNLLYENSDAEIMAVLECTTHIWISHEHPDHFSIPFFKKYKNVLRQNNIQLLFQNTNDKRVINFLESNGFKVKELDFNQRYPIGTNFRITCLKDGFYDSGLFIEAGATKILNLNDCEVRTRARAREIKKITGSIDVLLTQFSYAAWKGGVNNTAWRTEAAQEKLATVRLQVEEFEPKYCIPFASFIYFSNSENYYLNDSSNTLQDVSDLLVGMKCHLVCLKPLETFSTSSQHTPSRSAIEFWDQYFRKQKKQNNFQSLSYSELESMFDTYIRRITSGNNIVLMKLLSYISPVSIFQDVIIHLHDLKVTVKISLTHQKLIVTNEQAHLGMHSFMLGFIFKNTFGFDTLTVNGCFEELSHGGFVRATKSLAIENLNNLGFYLKFSNLFNFKIIFLFLNRLYRVSRKLE